MNKIIFLNDKPSLFVEGLIATVHLLGFTHENIIRKELHKLEGTEKVIIVIDLDVYDTTILKVIKKDLNLKNVEVLTFSEEYNKMKIDFLMYCEVIGVLTKDITVEMLADCLQSLLNNEPYIQPSLSKYFISNYNNNSSVKIRSTLNNNKENLLSEREMQVVRLLSQGKTDREVSEFLNISQTTVRNHIQNTYKKTKTKNRVQLLLFCVENKLIQLT